MMQVMNKILVSQLGLQVDGQGFHQNFLMLQTGGEVAVAALAQLLEGVLDALHQGSSSFLQRLGQLTARVVVLGRQGRLG